MHIELPKADYGVIVGRFQVPTLHNAHRDLIEGVLSRHAETLLMLGVTKIASKEDPLDFRSRHHMIKESYPSIRVFPILDVADDKIWSETLDQAIRSVFPMGSILLYGGRDSFLKSYSGKFPCAEVATQVSLCGTEVREQIRKQAPTTPEGRAGIIYGMMNRYSAGLGTADVLLQYGERWIFGRKKWEKGIRMIGGFFDPDQDNSFEACAKREAIEETGCEIGTPKYLGSWKVDDPRYRKSADKIVTTVFHAYILFGKPKAADDISEIVEINEVHVEDFVEEHQPIIAELLKNGTFDCRKNG